MAELTIKQTLTLTLNLIYIVMTEKQVTLNIFLAITIYIDTFFLTFLDSLVECLSDVKAWMSTFS